MSRKPIEKTKIFLCQTLYISGDNIVDIANKLGCSISSVFKYIGHSDKVIGVELGSKNEPYYEDEMDYGVRDFSNVGYDDLSYSEKEIWREQLK
tara:strand:- start:390 stop:671 length:282 start_codon:yes stop_codon:yes gene_type:complete